MTQTTTKIGVIICSRYGNCGAGKCFKALGERQGGFARYPADAVVEIAGFAGCGGCPGGNVESVPEEFKKNGVQIVHLATGMVVGYPPCPHIRTFKEMITARFNLPVVVGTHPIPLKYRRAHQRMSQWKQAGMDLFASDLMCETEEVMAAYD